jgi:restriction system protein
MDAADARETVLDRALDVSHGQFEQLCKMLIERAEQTRTLELTPFRGDGGIDVHAVIDRDLFHARLGVQAKQYSSGNTVGARTIRSFKGALSDQDYHIGTVITTSSFTSGAVDSAVRDDIRLIDGDTLAEILVGGRVGVVEQADGEFATDPGFWNAFDTPEDAETIPSLEVPQADDFDILTTVLWAVDSGTDTKPQITQCLEAETESNWDPRQADYYGIAGWLLGFLHKEQRVSVGNREVRRWGLTRSGEEYLDLLDRGDNQTATGRLHDAIRSVEVVSRVYDVLIDSGATTKSGIAAVLAEETALSGSTTARRAHTVGQWLVELPEIQTSGSGETQAYEYLRDTRDDVN